MNIIDYIKEKLNKNKSSNKIPEIVEYQDTSYKYESEILEGAHDKRFVRINSNFFKDVLNDIRNNPDCSYVTYLNSFLKENQDYAPEYISVLKKDFYEDPKMYFIENEILASRIANAMGVPTVYNAKYGNSLLSIDFLESGSRIINIEDKLQDFSETIDLYRDPSPFVNQICGMYQIINFHNDAYRGDKWNTGGSALWNSSLMHYLTRRFVIGDGDSFLRNMCLIVDKNNNLKLGPMFDMELGFSSYNMLLNNKYDLAYAIKHGPETFKLFDEKFKHLMTEDVLSSLFKGFDKKFVDSRKSYLKRQYSSYLEECKEARDLLKFDDEPYDY